MLLNELAQWGVLAFIAIFVLGLTRQLGFLLIPRQQQLEDLGPPLNRPIPHDLIGRSERTRLAQLIASSTADWAGLLVLDKGCESCTAMIADLERNGVPEDAPIVAITTDGAEDQGTESLHRVADLVIVDVNAERTERAGINATPFVMIVDKQLRIVHKHVGDLRFAVERWRAKQTSPLRASGGPSAGRRERRHVPAVKDS